jgi:hypothetical protein
MTKRMRTEEDEFTNDGLDNAESTDGNTRRTRNQDGT